MKRVGLMFGVWAVVLVAVPALAQKRPHESAEVHRNATTQSVQESKPQEESPSLHETVDWLKGKFFREIAGVGWKKGNAEPSYDDYVLWGHFNFSTDSNDNTSDIF
jgi:hypothetical protein